MATAPTPVPPPTPTTPQTLADLARAVDEPADLLVATLKAYGGKVWMGSSDPSIIYLYSVNDRNPLGFTVEGVLAASKISVQAGGPQSLPTASVPPSTPVASSASLERMNSQPPPAVS